MKVAFFTKYTRLGASSRLRTYLYLDYFKEKGIKCEVLPFFSDEYLIEVYRTRHHNKWLSFKSFLRRIFQLLGVRKYDFIVIEKELFPYMPAFFEWCLHVAGVRYAVDYDDAIFHNYDVSSNYFVKAFLGQKIDRVMRYSTLVTAGNSYIANKAARAGAESIVILPTVIDLAKYQTKNYLPSSPFTIGWIGSPITRKYLTFLKPVFEKLSGEFEIRLKLLGASEGLSLPGIEQVIRWTEEEEASVIQSFNVGIMPLEDNIWERGKCGYKLIQYMGCGVPVVGTPIGVNNEIIIDGWNGFKATTLEDWYNSLRLLIKNGIDYEREMGQNGRKHVEENYSLQMSQQKYLMLLKEQLSDQPITAKYE